MFHLPQSSQLPKEAETDGQTTTEATIRPSLVPTPLTKLTPLRLLLKVWRKEVGRFCRVLLPFWEQFEFR